MTPGAQSRRPSLPESEWAFHRIPEHERKAAAIWERMRHQGQSLLFAPNPFDLAVPWLDLSAEEKAHLTERLYAVLSELPITEKTLELAEQPNDPKVHWRTCLFSVNLAATKAELIDAFTAWLDRQPQFDKDTPRLPNEPTRWNSNHLPFDTWLIDIACWRANKAGLTRQQTLEQLAPLFKAAGLKDATCGRLSSKHWQEGIDRAEKLAAH